LILLNWKTQRPIDFQTARDVPWKVWRLAEKRVPEPNYTYEHDSNGEQVYLKTMAEECLNLLFDSNVSLHDLHPDVTPDEETQRKTHEIKQILNHNRRLWDPARYKGLGQPLDADRLLFKAKYPTYRRNDSSNPPKDNNPQLSLTLTASTLD